MYAIAAKVLHSTTKLPQKQIFFLKKYLWKLCDWEQWPLPFFKFPMGIVWLWFCLKSRSLWFFSSSNPTLEFGGFEGEGKKEMYPQMPPGTYPKTVFSHPGQSAEEVVERVISEKFQFPVAVKPDVGMKGLLLRKIGNTEQLAGFHRRCPVEYMVQEWVDLPIELGVFYFRYPDSPHGKISGLSWKEPIEVLGDGQSPLLDLIKNAPRAAARMEELTKKHAENLHRILPAGEKYQLTLAANRLRGARLHNLAHEIDAQQVPVAENFPMPLKNRPQKGQEPPPPFGKGWGKIF